MKTLGPSTRKAGQFTVFEILNARLREVYVGVAPDEALKETPLRFPPTVPILHWGLENRGLMRCVAGALDEEDARAFALNYAKTALPPGWRFVL